MRNKTVTVILIVAAAMFAYIYFVDSDSMTTEELTGRKGRVFDRFKRDFVDGLTLAVEGGQKVVLERTPTESGGEGDWKIVEPKEMKADGAEVRALLSAMDFALKDRTVKGDEANDARFGMGKPAVTGSFSMKGDTVSFRLGAKDGSGEKVYVKVDGVDEVHAVEADFLESMTKDLNDLRDKHLVDMDLGAADAVSFEGLRLEKGEGSRWRVIQGEEKILAATDQVSQLLQEISDLRAISFIADGVEEQKLGDYGLKDPAGRVKVQVDDQSLEILLGGACGDEGEGVTVAVAGTGVVACGRGDLSEALSRPTQRFVEMRPAPFEKEDVAGITLSHGDRKLELTKDDDDVWKMKDQGDTPVEQSAVENLLTLLCETRGGRLITGEEALGTEVEGITVILAGGDVANPVELTVGPGQEAKQLVRRKGEIAAIEIEGDLMAAATPEVTVFRRRVIENGHAHRISRMEITGPASQTLERKDDSWAITSPVKIEGDNTAVREVARLVAEIPVERFFADPAGHGLDKPFATVTAHLDEEESEKAETIVLEIGNETPDGGRFARVRGDDTIFELSQKNVDLFARPLVARDTIMVDPVRVREVKLASKAGELSAKLSDGEWTFDGASGDSVSLKRLLTDLGAAKAVRGYSFDTGAGFQDPALTLTLRGEGDDDSSTTIIFGDRSGQEKEDGYLAKTEDAKVVVVFPARIVDELLALIPPRS